MSHQRISPPQLPAPPARTFPAVFRWALNLTRVLQRGHREVFDRVSATPNWPGFMSPPQITADQNNYSVGQAQLWRLSTDALRTITGLADGGAGATRMIVNVGANTLRLGHQNAGSLAANRIICPGGVNLDLGPDGTATLIYDNTTDRWRVFATT